MANEVLVEHLGIGAEPRVVNADRFNNLMKDKGWTLVGSIEESDHSTNSVPESEEERVEE